MLIGYTTEESYSQDSSVVWIIFGANFHGDRIIIKKNNTVHFDKRLWCDDSLEKIMRYSHSRSCDAERFVNDIHSHGDKYKIQIHNISYSYFDTITDKRVFLGCHEFFFTRRRKLKNYSVIWIKINHDNFFEKKKTDRISKSFSKDVFGRTRITLEIGGYDDKTRNYKVITKRYITLKYKKKIRKSL